MQGQHIFARCWNEQGNAGTWTAAVTDNIVSKDTIRNIIEPRCNIDESLAQKALVKHSGNSVLRVYHLQDKTVVVSRTFWEADKITDSSSRGRMGAYTFSHILSGEDSLQFCRDFAGAFDSNCFETYDSLVNRTGAAQKKPITIDTDYSLFRHGEMPAKASLFEEIGLKKNSFIQLMSGIYFAIENKKQFAVVLPKNVRNAWEDSGDDQMEQAIYSLMGLLPDFTRENFNFVAHWNENLTNQMVNDMHLIFVHADEQETVTGLQREGFPVFDIESGNIFGEVPMAANDYFAFLWENRENRQTIEEFWSYAKSGFAKLLKMIPNSAAAIQCIYLIKRTVDSEYRNTKIGVKAFELASELFAGAGKRIPAAEQFIHDAITRLDIGVDTLDPSIEKSLSRIIQRDKEPNAHQEQEYNILLSACAKGEVSSETVDILCDELLKEGRGAEPYYARFLSVHENDSILNSAQSMTSLVIGIFCRLFCTPDHVNRSAEIQLSIFSIMKKWLQELSTGDYPVLDLIIDSVAAYFAAGGNDASMVAAGYAFLFKAEINASEKNSKRCAEIIFKEEKKIYHGRSPLNNGEKALHAFFEAFSSCFQECDKRNKWVAEDFYGRLYRLLFLEDEYVSDGAKNLYQEKIEESISTPLQMYALQRSELPVLEDVKNAPAIWSIKKVADDVVKIEKINLSFENYQLNRERIASLIPLFDCCRLECLEVILEYVKRLPSDERYQLYSQIKKNKQINNLFCFAFFFDDFAAYLKEITSFAELTFGETLNTLLGSQVEGVSLETDESVLKFTNWYMLKADEKLNKIQHDDQSVFLSDYFGVIKEYKDLIKQKASSNTTLVNLVCSELDGRMLSIIKTLPLNVLARVSQTDLRDLSKMLPKETDMGARETSNPTRTTAIRILLKIDECDNQNTSMNSKVLTPLCNICCNTMSTDYSEIVIERFKYLYEQHGEKRAWIERYWLFIGLMEEKACQFNLEKFKSRSGYKNYNDKKKIAFWITTIEQLTGESPEFERLVVQAYLTERLEVFEKNKKLLEDEEIRKENYNLIRNNQTVRQVLSQQPEKRLQIDRTWRVSREIPQITWGPLLIVLCVIVGLASAFAALGALKLLAMSLAGGILDIIIGAVIALLLFTIGLFIFNL